MTRNVHADAASHLMRVQAEVGDRMPSWVATFAATLDPEAESIRTDDACVEALLKLGAEWDDLLRRVSRLWETVERRRVREAQGEHVSVRHGRAAGVPLVDPAHAGMRPLRPAPRRSRVAELADVAYGMAPAPDTADVPL